MDPLLSKLEQLFADDEIVADNNGVLAAAASAAPHPSWLLSFFGDRAGVRSAAALKDSVPLSLAREIAAARDADNNQLFRVGRYPWGGRELTVVVAGVENDPAGSYWAGVFDSPPPSDAELERSKPLWTACARLIREANAGRSQVDRLSARLRQLEAEHDTLKAAHTESVAAAMNEQSRRLEEERERLAAEQQCAATKAASEAKTQFLANMSHEIRTPLTAILGFTELLRSGADDGDEAARQEYLENIYRSANHLLELINAVLDLSKIEAGRMQLERIACSPHEIIAGVISPMRVRAKEKGLKLSVVWPQGIPSQIETDPLRLKQLLINLVGNAVKFTNQGEVRLVCRLLDEGGRGRIAFDVIDTGVGIPADKLDEIFDAFSQADSSVTRQFGGTGLGLAISRRIARAMGGDITVRSEFGKGSTFTAVVDVGPLDRAALIEPPSTDAVAHESPKSLAAAMARPLRNARVLLVEDGVMNRKLITLILQKAGMEVVTAENGRDGYEVGRRGGFDAILMDMQMPVMDGYTATRKLRDEGISTPIIALTAHAMSGDEQKCRDAGCTAYLTKPVRSQVLLGTIASVVASVAPPVVAAVDRASAPPAGDMDESAGRTGAEHQRGPIVSTLGTDDPDFREIVEEFVLWLPETLGEITAALDQGRFEDAARLAHTLKGTAGGAGFDVLTAPSKQLELAARGGDGEATTQALAKLRQLAERIAMGAGINAPAPGSEPYHRGNHHV